MCFFFKVEDDIEGNGRDIMSASQVDLSVGRQLFKAINKKEN
jgi:hypothetical protein